MLPMLKSISLDYSTVSLECKENQLNFKKRFKLSHCMIMRFSEEGEIDLGITIHLKILACRDNSWLRNYYPFKKYVEYIFSPGCLSMMSRAILRL